MVLSKNIADKLRLTINDKVTCGIIRGNTYRKQKMIIGGIYNTGLAEYDSKFAIVDIGKIQFFNHWGRDSVGGFEVFVNDINRMDAIEENINGHITTSIIPQKASIISVDFQTSSSGFPCRA